MVLCYKCRTGEYIPTTMLIVSGQLIVIMIIVVSEITFFF